MDEENLNVTKLIDELQTNESLRRQLSKLAPGELEKLVEMENIQRMRRNAKEELKRPVCLRIREDVLKKLDNFTKGEENFEGVEYSTSLSGAIETMVEIFLNNITGEKGLLDKTSSLYTSFFKNYNGNKSYAGRSGTNRKAL